MITKEFSLNGPQADVLTVSANKTIIVWGRGTGKTTGVLGPKSVDFVHKMPRSKGCIIGKDYEQLLDRTLPEIVSVWEQLGYYQDEHWRLGKPLPGWDTAIIPPLKFDNVISWYNGTAVHLLSLAVKAPANGLSLQWAVGDEMKFWKKPLLHEILKALRGLRKEFGHLHEYLGYVFATDKYTDDVADIQWILSEKNKMDPQAVEVVRSLQLYLNERMSGYDLLPDREKAIVDAEVQEIQKVITPLRKNLFYYSEASAEENLVVLGQHYISSQKKDLDKEEFDVAIRNLDPTKTKDCFYPSFSAKHKYKSRSDVDVTRPLIIGPDYQASISPIPTAQFGCLPGMETGTLNFVRSVFTLQPQGLKDAVRLWADTFSDHVDKTVYYVYDHTGIGRNPSQEPYRKMVVDTLEELGWAVFEIYIGRAPDHHVKYEKIKEFYEIGPDDELPEIRHNELLSNECIISMERAKTKMVLGVTKKDKRHEDVAKYRNYPQQFAPHFSDGHDMILWATHHLKLIPFYTDDVPFLSSMI